MRFAKVAAAATALSLVGAATLVSPAKAVTTSGVGTSAASSSLLDVALGTAGSVLNLRLLADDARSTIDPSVAAPEAFSRLSVASITSSLLPAPFHNFQVPIVESRTPGGSGNVASPGLNLGTIVPVALPVALPVSLLGGVLAPATLTSGVDATGAHSALTSSLGNISLVGGLISATGLNSTLGTAAKANQADGSRTVKANAINVLDLGALLDGLGLPLDALPIDAVSGILDGLGLGLPGLPTDLDLATFVDTLNDTLGDLAALTDDGSVLTSALPAGTTSLLGGLGIPLIPNVGAVPDVGDPLSLVTGVIGQVTDVLSGLLETALSALDGVSLLSADGIEVGTVTRASDTVGGSAADIVAKIGSLSVGGLALPGLDLTSALATVNSTLATVNGTISDVLGSIAPGLESLINVSMFGKDPATGVTSANGYTKSLAGVTALTASITPPLNIDAIIGGLLDTASLTDSIGAGILDAGGTLPALSGLMGTFNGLLGDTPLNAVSSLLGGATIKVASVTSGATFTTPVAATGGSLPRTGGTAQMALLGMALVIAAVASRRYVLTHRA
ncbi:MAG: hypothetical protein QOF21_153 [Actinomycetota bacterium]|jgi:hypothetical protein